MLAMAANEPFDSAAHLFEVKWDGVRCLTFVEGGRVRLQSRQLMEISAQFPELDALRALPEGTVLDGELVVLEGGQPALVKVQQRVHLQDQHRIRFLSQKSPAVYIVFDLLYVRGRSIMSDSLANRRAMLCEMIGPLLLPGVHVTESVPAVGRAVFVAAMRTGLEGVMAKRADGQYLSGKRSRAWLKIKPGPPDSVRATSCARNYDGISESPVHGISFKLNHWAGA